MSWIKQFLLWSLKGYGIGFDFERGQTSISLPAFSGDVDPQHLLWWEPSAIIQKNWRIWRRWMLTSLIFAGKNSSWSQLVKLQNDRMINQQKCGLCHYCIKACKAKLALSWNTDAKSKLTAKSHVVLDPVPGEWEEREILPCWFISSTTLILSLELIHYWWSPNL